jgi:glyoxylase-like metal-dependent hydrolase (beta-lactamase superfamily II)
MKTKVQTFFDDVTYTLTYIVYDENSKDAVVIDSVWDYDQAASSLTEHSAHKVISFVDENKLNVHYILETHAHADHLTGSQLLKKKYPEAKIGIGENIKAVQEVFSEIYNLKDFNTSGVQFDVLFKDEEVFSAGTLNIKVLNTPGHTPACVSYLVNEEAVFTGDALFMPDFGTGRCDFPKGSATDLYDSITNKLYTLDDEVKVFVGHDYQPGGRKLAYETTIGESKMKNKQLKADTSREDFIEFRTNRDRELNAPKLLLPSIQVNIDAGALPKVEENGMSYLKIPLTKES